MSSSNISGLASENLFELKIQLKWKDTRNKYTVEVLQGKVSGSDSYPAVLPG